MLMVCHHLDKNIPEDVAFAESRACAPPLPNVAHALPNMAITHADMAYTPPDMADDLPNMAHILE
eukprot:7379232-Prymnesium_polylepis.1